MGGDPARKLRPKTCKFDPAALQKSKAGRGQSHSLKPHLTCSLGLVEMHKGSMTNLDEAEQMAGRLEDVEASILWHNEVDIEVDIEASERPAVAV